MSSLKNLGTVTQATPIIDSVLGKSQDLQTLSNALKDVSAEALLSASSTAKLSENQLACALSAKGLSNAEIASELAAKGFGEMAVYSALSASGLRDEEIEAAMANVTFASSANVATKSANKFGLAFNGLAAKIGISTTALGTLLGVAAGLAVVAVGVQMYNAHVQELVDNAREAASALSESTSSLEAYSKRVEELRTALDSGTLSEEEAYQAKSELFSIQESLSESYGDQVKGIDLVNGSIARQIALIEELNEANADQYLNENHTAIKKAERELAKNRTYSIGQISLSSFGDDVDALNVILEKYRDYLHTTDLGDDITQTVYFEGNAEDASEVLNSLMVDLRSASSEFKDSSIFNKFMNGVSEQINAADEVLENYQDVYDQAQIATLVTDDRIYKDGETGQTAAKWLNDYAESVQDYNEALQSGDTTAIEEAASNFESVDSSVQALLKNSGMSAYAEQFADVAAQLDNATIAQNTFIDAIAGTGEIEGKNYSFFADFLKENSFTDVDFKYAVNTDGVQAGEAAINSLIDAAQKAEVINGKTEEDIQLLIDILVKTGYLIDSFAQDTVSNVEILHRSYEELSESVANAVVVQASAKEAFSDYTYITEDAYNIFLPEK